MKFSIKALRDWWSFFTWRATQQFEQGKQIETQRLKERSEKKKNLEKR